MVINQGDLIWANPGRPFDAEPGYRHPFVVIQNNAANHSRLDTVIACMLTTNLDRAAAPGNVLLAKGEANLRKRSVVNVSQIYALDKSRLEEKIGSLPQSRVLEIIAGLTELLEPSA